MQRSIRPFKAAARPLASAALSLAVAGALVAPNAARARSTHSPMVSSEALPPAAVVLMVSVRSPAKRSR